MFEEVDSLQLRRIWSQVKTPVVFKRGSRDDLMIRLPYSPVNREWIKADRRNKPNWNVKYKCWETPRAWFDDLILACLGKYGKVYVIQRFQEQQKCAPACLNAKGFDCECSCMGANHGKGNSSDWHIVSDTFAVQWSERKYACRLIQANDKNQN